MPVRSAHAGRFWFRLEPGLARVVKRVDTRDLNDLSLRGETPEVKPVKVGERPECFDIRANAEPSPSHPAGKV